MNAKAIYYIDRHLERIAKRIKFYLLPWVPMAGMTEALKELYGVHLIGKDSVKYNLICKYEDRISNRLLFEKNKLHAKGEAQADLVYRENPLLKMISKGDDFRGSYMPIPLIYGADQ